MWDTWPQGCGRFWEDWDKEGRINHPRRSTQYATDPRPELGGKSNYLWRIRKARDLQFLFWHREAMSSVICIMDYALFQGRNVALRLGLPSLRPGASGKNLMNIFCLFDTFFAETALT